MNQNEPAKAEEWPISKNWWLSIRNERGEGRFEAFDFILIKAESGEYSHTIASIMVPKIDGIVSQSHSFISMLIHENTKELEAKLAKAEADLKKAIEGLKFYADKSNWLPAEAYRENLRIEDSNGGCNRGDYIYGGKLARKILAELAEEK